MVITSKSWYEDSMKHIKLGVNDVCRRDPVNQGPLPALCLYVWGWGGGWIVSKCPSD